jgi:hypothetical protein
MNIKLPTILALVLGLVILQAFLPLVIDLILSLVIFASGWYVRGLQERTD